jgi:tetratricopeptide (TPR) repeat protein
LHIALGRDEEALEHLSQAAQSGARRTLTAYLAGVAYRRLGLDSRWTSEWRKTGDERALAEYLCAEATQYLKQQNTDEAMRMFLASVALDPTYAPAYYSVAGLSWGKNQDMARWALEQAVAHDRTDSAAKHIAVGQIYLLDSQWASAQQAFELATQLEPSCAQAWRYWGVALYRDHQDDRAIQRLHTALVLHPHDGWAHEYLGRIYYGQSSFARAARHLLRATTLSDPGVATYELLRRAIGNLEGDEALGLVDELEEAANAFPTNEWYAICLGATYELLGATDRAEAEYARALSVNPRNRIAAESLADLQHR